MLMTFALFVSVKSLFGKFAMIDMSKGNGPNPDEPTTVPPTVEKIWD